MKQSRLNTVVVIAFTLSISGTAYARGSGGGHGGSGRDHIEISAAGYQPLVVDVTIQAHHKIEYRGTLTRSLPGSCG